MSDAAPRLLLPRELETQLWQHARRDAPQECVGVLGGQRVDGGSAAGGGWQASRLYPLVNRAAYPQREYLAEAAGMLRALRAMRTEALELVAIYHSHPHGPAHFSLTDQQQAAYDVPYLIADLVSGHLSAYWLPEGVECELKPDE